ncbi:hypothetical protein D0867_07051 [Hortaea werneckii]|uniref:Uncharacterized protein n=1 Tax=Hortaea werneckii TaxID=91943 RepID=A0A3M6ZHI2_HORWE|nr:hypothetical protein D0867_07051 [Hortaea werneckii]
MALFQEHLPVMSQYQAQVPNGDLVKPEIHKYFESFYTISDTPDIHQKYSEQFTQNAKLIMASKEAQGRNGKANLDFQRQRNIGLIRIGMWEKVAKRSHKPVKIFPFGAGSDEVMLFGTVDYELKDGKKASVDWAARAHFAQEDGALKMDFYQVYLLQDTAAMSKAK